MIGWVLLKGGVNMITQPWFKRQSLLEKEDMIPFLQKGEEHSSL